MTPLRATIGDLRAAVWKMALTPSAKLVALRLTEHYPSAFGPSAAMLREKCGLSPGQVRGALRELERLEVIEVRRTTGLASTYKIAVPPHEHNGCSHKFVDSKACLKCGWVAPPRGAPVDPRPAIRGELWPKPVRDEDGRILALTVQR